MADSSSKTYWKFIIALSLVHFSGDFYSSFMSPLFPVFIDRMGLSLAQVGLIAGISRFLMFIVQPLSGYWADRHPSRSFILIGLLMPILFIPLTGMTTGFYGLLFCIAIASAGSSLFHPPVTGMVPLYAGRNLGLAMSIYNTSGTLAFGVGPIFITWYVARFGLGAMPVTMVIGLLIWIYFYRVIPKPEGDDMAQYGFLETLRQTLGNVWQPILLIWIVMVSRALVGQSLMTFMPVLWVQKGIPSSPPVSSFPSLPFQGRWPAFSAGIFRTGWGTNASYGLPTVLWRLCCSCFYWLRANGSIRPRYWQAVLTWLRCLSEW